MRESTLLVDGIYILTIYHMSHNNFFMLGGLCWPCVYPCVLNILLSHIVVELTTFHLRYF